MIKTGSYTNDVVPLKFQLSQNYPNPFKEKTKIKYCVPFNVKVTIIVINSNGEVVDKLIDAEKPAGTYEVEFNAGKLQPGIYFYQMIAGEFYETKQMEI